MANANETKRIPVVSAEITNAFDATKSALTLTCINGETLEIKRESLSADVIGYAIMHGLKQKLVDAAAMSRNPDTGKSATPDEKWAAVKAVYERLINGQWNATRGEGGIGAGGLLFRALCRMYPAKTPEALREFLAGKSDAEQAAMRANPKVARVIEEIKAESAKKADVDTDAMLDELEGE